jgi:signal peptidase I
MDVKPARAAKHRRPATPKSFLRELPVLLLVAIVLALFIKTFFVQAFFIPSGSMEETLQIGDRVLVNKLVYRFRDIHRGDVVVFNGLDSFVQDSDARIAAPPGNPVQRIARGMRSLVGLGDPGEKDFIKRVIGLPGDTVACCTNRHVTVNGKPLDEAGYVFEDDRQVFAPVVVAPGKIWVMGDHRSQSSDSRANGQVPSSRVLGRAVVVVWPAGHVKGLRAPATFEGRPRVRVASAAATSPLGLAGVVTFTGYGVRRRRRHVRVAGRDTPTRRTLARS